MSKPKLRPDDVKVESFATGERAPKRGTRGAGTRGVSCDGTCVFTGWDTCGRTCYETCRPRLCGM